MIPILFNRSAFRFAIKSMARVLTEKSIRKQSRSKSSAVSSNREISVEEILSGVPYILAEVSRQTIIGPFREAWVKPSFREGFDISLL